MKYSSEYVHIYEQRIYSQSKKIFQNKKPHVDFKNIV